MLDTSSTSTKAGYAQAEYAVWEEMHRRCTDAQHPLFGFFGGKGITIHPDWLSFDRFFEDMGHRPNCSFLSRRNVYQDFSPGNCFWHNRATEQDRRYKERKYTYGEVTRTLGEWAKQSRLPASLVHHRLCRGWDFEEALFVPRPRKKTR
jgi:hypothetical protein